MSPDSQMALAIGIVAIGIPAVLALFGVAMGVWGAVTRRRWAVVLGFGEAVAVAIAWFFAFGIEYVPRYEASPLVVPDAYEGAALLIACPDAGTPEGETVTIGPNGVARQKRPPRYDRSPTVWRATRASGAAVNVSEVGGEAGPDSPCEYLHLHVGDSPYNHTTDRYADLLAEVEATGKSFAEVHRAHELR